MITLTTFTDAQVLLISVAALAVCLCLGYAANMMGGNKRNK